MKKKQIQNLSDHIARLTAERALADSGAYTAAEVEKFDRGIRAARKQIIDLLSTTELKKLSASKLAPEQAAEIIEDEPVTTVPDDLQKAVWNAQNAEQSTRTFYIAEKTFSAPLNPNPNRPIEAATDSLKKFAFTSTKPDVPRVTPADAFLNHVRSNQ